MDRAEKFINNLNKSENFSIINKKNSIFMKFLSFILFFVDFEKYSTTAFGTMYLSDADIHIEDRIIKIAHEFKHILDFKNKFNNIIYLFPQILTFLLLPLVIFHWGFIFSLLFLLPWPAFFRKNLELAGYKVTLFTIHEFALEKKFDKVKTKKIIDQNINLINSTFTGAAYYFMWPFGVRKELEETVKLIMNDKILETDDIYKIVRNALRASKE